MTRFRTPGLSENGIRRIYKLLCRMIKHISVNLFCVPLRATPDVPILLWRDDARGEYRRGAVRLPEASWPSIDQWCAPIEMSELCKGESAREF